MQNRTRLDEELLKKKSKKLKGSEKLHKVGGGGVRETPRSWERFSVKEKMVDFLLSSVSTEKAQRVDADRGNHFRDRFTPWMMMDQASGRVYMLYDVHALVMSCPHREEQLKLPQSISGSSFDLDCLQLLVAWPALLPLPCRHLKCC